jgi:hypothetical protein
MSTNASIKYNDTTVYLHWDGYPTAALETLKKHYNTPELAEELLKHGNISSLESSIEESVFYHRDRGEELEFWDEPREYNYEFENGKWREALLHLPTPVKCRCCGTLL